MPDKVPSGTVQMDPIESVEIVQNGDVINLIDWIDSFLVELAINQSHATKTTHPADLGRYRNMAALFADQLTLKAARPPLDLPASHPRQRKLPEPPILFAVENPYNMELITLWSLMRIEMAMSQSADKASSFERADLARYEGLLAKIVETHDAIERFPGIDLPDSDSQSPA